MAQAMSIERLRGRLPLQYRGWVQAATVITGTAYCITSLQHLVDGQLNGPLAWLEPSVIFAAALGYLFARIGQPRVGAWLLVLTVAIELHASILVSSRHQLIEGVVMNAALITAVGLLLGARVAVLCASASSLLIAVTHYFGWSQNLGVGAAALSPVMAVASAMLGTSGLMLVFQRSMGEVVELARRNEEEARELIEDSPDGMLALDQETRITIANRAAALALNVELASLTGKRLSELPLQSAEGEPVPSPADLVSLGTSALSTLDGKRHFEVLVRRRSSENEDEGWIVVFHDVTARENALAKSKDLSRQLQHAQKMEAIGRLAGGIAHDFNNLLTVIGGYAELLAESKDKRVRTLASGQLEAYTRCAALTRQLLTFARKDVVARRSLEICSLLEGLEELLHRLLGEQVVVDLDLKGPCPIIADPGQMEQVILNLASNAGDAMRDRGTLTIRCSSLEDLVTLELQDTGPGMDEATRNRAFEPFFTTKDRSKGTGLGLATVQAIVAEHDARIEVDTALGRGCTFRIVFQRSDSPVEGKKEPQPSLTTWTGQGTILLVDDSELVRNVVRRQLIRSGFEVVCAKSGAEALGILQSSEFSPELLLTDVMMPGMTGPELVERVARHRAELPVLFMSGYIDDVLDIAGVDVEHDLLLKPFSRQVLLDHVRTKLQGGV